MEQLNIWDMENVGVETHDKTGHIVKLGEEVLIMSFPGGDYLKNSIAKDKLTGKLYLKQTSRRKEPFQFIDWPMITYIEIDEESFKNGYVLDKELVL